LSDVGIKQPIVFIRLAQMVIRFISQALPFIEEILPAFIQRHVKKIFAQTTQSKQGVKLLFAKSSKLIFLSGVHNQFNSLYLKYIAN
jgi:hypothetical protein